MTGDYEELECAGGGRRLAYARRYSPSKGILTLQWNGTFTYEADPHEHEMMYEFSYDLHCLDAASSSSSSPSTEPMTPEERAVLQDSDRALCSGRVFLIVSPYWTAPTSLPAPFVNRSELTCSGSCTASPWSIYPQGPRWDGYRAVTPAGSSALTLRWSKEGDEDGVVMTLRTVLGTMGVTFPTFRVLRSRAGKFMEPEDWDVVGGGRRRVVRTRTRATTSPSHTVRPVLICAACRRSRTWVWASPCGGGPDPLPPTTAPVRRAGWGRPIAETERRRGTKSLVVCIAPVMSLPIAVPWLLCSLRCRRRMGEAERIVVARVK